MQLLEVFFLFYCSFQEYDFMNFRSSALAVVPFRLHWIKKFIQIFLLIWNVLVCFSFMVCLELKVVYKYLFV